MKRFLVIGDIMLDHTIYGTVDRISPEAPIPVLQRRDELFRLGGAGNAARNLRAVTRTSGVYLIGFADHRVKDLANTDNINHDFCSTIEMHRMNTKLRVVDTRTGYQLIRIDNELEINMKNYPLDANRLQSILELHIRPDAILVSDYGKGSISDDVAKILVSYGQACKVPVVVDTRKHDPYIYRGASFMTPNLRELRAILEVQGFTGKIKEWLEYMDLEGVLHTMGEHGMELHLRDGRFRSVKPTYKDIVDVTGAGDTAAAVFTAMLALDKEKDYGIAMKYANDMAGEVCLIKGTAVPKNSLACYGYEDQE